MADEAWEVKENAYIYCEPAGPSVIVIDDGSNLDVCSGGWSWCVAGPVWRCCNDGWEAISVPNGVFDRRRYAKNTGELATSVWAGGNALKFQRAAF